MINTTGDIISAVVDKTMYIKMIEDKAAQAKLDLKQLTTTALNYPELIKAAQDTGILCMNQIVTHTVEQGFIISREIPYAVTMNDELTSADQTKLNKGE